MPDLSTWFIVHPRKRVARTPLYDWAGCPMPKTLDGVYGSYSSKKRRQHMSIAVRSAISSMANVFCIASHNINMFTVDFDFPHPETGEMMHAHIPPCLLDE